MRTAFLLPYRSLKRAVMSVSTRWLILLAACGAAVVTLQRRRKPRNHTPTAGARAAALNEWENEGGNVALTEHAASKRSG